MHPHESRYCRLVDGPPSNPRGSEQFYLHESTGQKPADPDPYYLRLVNGKKWWDWTVTQWRGMVGGWEWPGWVQVEQDFKNDPDGFSLIFGRKINHDSQAHTGHSGPASADTGG